MKTYIVKWEIYVKAKDEVAAFKQWVKIRNRTRIKSGVRFVGIEEFGKQDLETKSR